MRGATSPRLLLELMCAQVLLPAASTGEKALLARLERLEHQLTGVEVKPGEPRGETVRSRRPQHEQAVSQPARSAGVSAATAPPGDGRTRRPGSAEDASEADAPSVAGRAREREERGGRAPTDRAPADQSRAHRARGDRGRQEQPPDGEERQGREPPDQAREE